ncbi:MAG: hypothetical protein GY716_21920, partial [bacterium]|nr:hypothetical protein [bacterium]
AKDDDSIVEMTYDSLSRALTEKQGPNPFGAAAKTVTYTYDAESNLTKIDYPSGFDANRTYDDIGRLTEIEDGSSVSVQAMSYYGGGYRKSVLDHGNTTTTTFSYDGYRRPTEISHEDSNPTELAGFEYGWDKNDNPLYEAHSHNSGKGFVYSYDRSNRLTRALTEVADPAAEVA